MTLYERVIAYASVPLVAVGLSGCPKEKPAPPQPPPQPVKKERDIIYDPANEALKEFGIQFKKPEDTVGKATAAARLEDKLDLSTPDAVLQRARELIAEKKYDAAQKELDRMGVGMKPGKGGGGIAKNEDVIKKALALFFKKEYGRVITILDTYNASPNEVEDRAYLLGASLLNAGIEKLRKAYQTQDWTSFPGVSGRTDAEKIGPLMIDVTRNVDNLIASLSQDQKNQIYANAGWVVHQGKAQGGFRKKDSPQNILHTFYSVLLEGDSAAFKTICSDGTEKFKTENARYNAETGQLRSFPSLDAMRQACFEFTRKDIEGTREVIFVAAQERAPTPWANQKLTFLLQQEREGKLAWTFNNVSHHSGRQTVY